MNDIADLLRSMGSRPDDDAPALNPEAQVEILTEFAERYGQHTFQCPFKSGDLVTPRSDSAVKDAGAPHIVLEVEQAPMRVWEAERGGSFDGARLNLRVASLHSSGAITTYWVESHCFDLYHARPAA